MEETGDDIETDVLVLDKINQYYLDKSKYEKKYDAKRDKILKSGKSKLAKTTEIRNLKYRCIDCNKEGKHLHGMRFTSKKINDDNARELSYTCNATTPCKKQFKVVFSIGKHVDDLITKDQEYYNNIVDVLLKKKYNLLFDYVDIDTYGNVKKITELYTEYKTNLADLLERSQVIKNNADVQQQLELWQTELRRCIDLPVVEDATLRNEKIKGIFRSENHLQSIKHPTVSFELANTTETFTFNHPYTLPELIVYY